MKPKTIKKVVCNEFNVPIHFINSPSRKREFTLPRQVAQFFTFKITGMSYTQVGENVGNRQRGTVMSSIDTVNDLMYTNAEFRKKIMKINNDLIIRGAIDIFKPKTSMQTYEERKQIFAI